MEYKKCHNCQSSIISRKLFSITTLKGLEIFVNPEMYCGKDCFLSHKVIKNGEINYDLKKSLPKSGTSQNKEIKSILARLIRDEMN
jgi:hypothetical protein